MRCLRRGWWLLLGFAALGMLVPTPAWADGLDGAFAALELVLAQLLGALLGVVAAIAALRSRSRGVWLFALALAAANAVTGAVVLLTTQLVPPFTLPSSLQVLLGVVVGPCLLVWRQAGLVPGYSALPARRSRRWLVLWILTNMAVGWVAQVATVPISTRVLPLLADGSQPGALQLLLITIGVVNGTLFGSVQWVLLRDLLGVNASWVALTVVGSALAGAVAPSFSAHTALGLMLSGTIVAAAEWPVLRKRLYRSWLWVPLGAFLSFLQAPVLAGVAASQGGWVVLGWLLNAFKALVTGLVLQRLARPTPAPRHNPAATTTC